MNRFECIGRLTKDVNLQTMNTGTSLAKFSIAVDRRFKDSNGDKITDFFNCSAFNGLAETISKYCHKGSKVYISGELQNRSWENELGEKQYLTEIKVNDCEFLDSKPKEDNPNQEQVILTPVEDDLPF